MTYVQRFERTDQAAAYDDYFKDGTYTSLLWSLEQEQLLDVLGRTGHSHPADYLDFATGTGRVLEALAPRAGHARGIDASAAMAERARQRVPGVEVQVRDITDPGAEVEGRYDVITAFRFVLNAGPDLAVTALRALRERLRDESSILVLNNQSNLTSHRAVLYPWHRYVRRSSLTWDVHVMSSRRLVALCAQAGLEAERVAGCGLWGGRLARVVPDRLLLSSERRFATSGLSWLGGNQMYVARRRS